MSNGKNSDQAIDIHGYVRKRLCEANIDPEEDPQKTREFIKQVCTSYLIQADHKEIADHEYHYITIVRIEDLVNSALQKYRQEVERFFVELSEVSEIPDEEVLEMARSAGRFTIGNNLTLSYSMAYELVEDLMRKLIPEILREDVAEGAGDVVLSELGSYSGKADILRACRIIDKETRKSIRHIKDIRNSLVHDVAERYSISILGDLKEINRVQETVNTLYEEVYEVPAYKYTDEI